MLASEFHLPIFDRRHNTQKLLMKKIGLLGCGAIGMQIAQAIDSGTIPAKLVSVYDQDEKRASALIAKLSDKPRHGSKRQCYQSFRDCIFKDDKYGLVCNQCARFNLTIRWYSCVLGSKIGDGSFEASTSLAPFGKTA